MNRPIVWSIGGSDSGAGAGIQADLRALDTFDVHACTAIAAITAQNSVAVDRVEAVGVDLLESQLAALAADLPPAAVKTGLLGSADNVRCVARWVDRLRRDRPVALVVDPVWRASTGRDLAGDALRHALRSELLPRATLVTPNRAEAAWLLGRAGDDLASPAAVADAAQALLALGPRAVAITGGDSGGERSADWMQTPEADGWLSLPRVDTRHHHGSGCVFASSAAAAMALDFCAADAIVIAKMSATHALAGSFGAGAGAGAVRPQRGFGHRADLLPTLDAPSPGHAPPCAPLRDAAMGLYAIADRPDQIDTLLAAGVRTLQLRIKDPAAAGLSEAIRRSVAAASSCGAQLLINDHWRLAIEHRAHGVHLGQDDLRDADLRALQDAGLRVGISTHAYWEVCRALAKRPSYIACGPIHATRTKDMPWQPQGDRNLRYWCQLLPLPVVAIGGMTVDRSRDAARCGAAGVAVLSGVARGGDTARAVDAYREAIASGAAAARAPAAELARSTLSWNR